MAARIDIDRSIFFKLLLIVNLTARPFAQMHEKAHGLSLTEWRVLLALAARPRASAVDLTQVLGLDKMAISRAVRALERSGRIERRPSAADSRRSELHLTRAGRALHAAIAPSGARREALLLQGLTAAERTALAGLLDKLVARARQLPDGA